MLLRFLQILLKTEVSKNGQNPPIFLTGFLPRQKLLKQLNIGLLSRLQRGQKVGNSLWPIYSPTTLNLYILMTVFIVTAVTQNHQQFQGE